MWSRAASLSDADLARFTVEEDLIQVRSGFVSHGTVVLGEIRIPAVKDELGPGYTSGAPTNTIGLEPLLHDRSRIPDVWASVGVGAFGPVFIWHKVMTQRIHDPPSRGDEDVVFHLILHVEGKRDTSGRPHLWQAIQIKEYPLGFFNDQ